MCIIDKREIDIKEERKVDAFLSKGCSCRRGRQCCNLFSKDYYLRKREECQELSRECLDIAVMGYLIGCQNTSNTLDRSTTHREGKKRERIITTYYHAGHKVGFARSSKFITVHTH